MKHLLLALCLLSGSVAMAQVNGIDDKVITAAHSKNDTSKVFMFVEQMPQCNVVMDAWLTKNLHYPAAAVKDGIEGKVIVRMLINEDGSVGDCTVVRGIGHGCDEEAVRVLKMMPPWKPGKQGGKAVKVYMTQPVSFRLAQTNNK